MAPWRCLTAVPGYFVAFSSLVGATLGIPPSTLPVALVLITSVAFFVTLCVIIVLYDKSRRQQFCSTVFAYRAQRRRQDEVDELACFSDAWFDAFCVMTPMAIYALSFTMLDALNPLPMLCACGALLALSHRHHVGVHFLLMGLGVLPSMLVFSRTRPAECALTVPASFALYFICVRQERSRRHVFLTSEALWQLVSAASVMELQLFRACTTEYLDAADSESDLPPRCLDQAGTAPSLTARGGDHRTLVSRAAPTSPCRLVVLEHARRTMRRRRGEQLAEEENDEYCANHRRPSDLRWPSHGLS